MVLIQVLIGNPLSFELSNSGLHAPFGCLHLSLGRNPDVFVAVFNMVKRRVALVTNDVILKSEEYTSPRQLTLRNLYQRLFLILFEQEKRRDHSDQQRYQKCTKTSGCQGKCPADWSCCDYAAVADTCHCDDDVPARGTQLVEVIHWQVEHEGVVGPLEYSNKSCEGDNSCY